jgi:hypothetical protein
LYSYGVDPSLILTNPGVQQCNLRLKPSTSLHTRPFVRSNYTRPEVGLFKRNTADLEEQTSKKKSLSLRCKQLYRRTPETSEVEV